MKKLLALSAAFTLLLGTLTGYAAEPAESIEEPASEVQASDEGLATDPISDGLRTPSERLGIEPQLSPDWVTALPEASTAQQLFVVAQASGENTAWVSMHQKESDGKWYMIMTTPGFIGMNGLGKTKEGDAKTPVGTFSFNRAFGIASDPGCAIPYVKVDENSYWSGDPDYHYNELVDIRDYPELAQDDSEHIVDYIYEYEYCLNISYNADGTAGAGSAIFLHCLGNRKPRTGGCVAIPMDQMYFVMQNVDPDCVVVINSLESMGGDF